MKSWINVWCGYMFPPKSSRCHLSHRLASSQNDQYLYTYECMTQGHSGAPCWCCAEEVIGKECGVLCDVWGGTLCSKCPPIQGHWKPALISILALVNPRDLILTADKNKKNVTYHSHLWGDGRKTPFLAMWLRVIWQLFRLPIHLGVWISELTWEAEYHWLYKFNGSFLKWFYSYPFPPPFRV